MPNNSNNTYSLVWIFLAIWFKNNKCRLLQGNYEFNRLYEYFLGLEQDRNSLLHGSTDRYL
ncbi:hypothetical protein CCP3SC1AL1_3010005 [Gammaproteobacteria bacterium]